jgi:hypothetical protein
MLGWLAIVFGTICFVVGMLDSAAARAPLASRGLSPGPMVQRADTSTIPCGTGRDFRSAPQGIESWVPGTRPGMKAVEWERVAIQ